jgi:hypothetical protein
MAWRFGTLCYYLTILILFLLSVSGILIGDIYRASWGFLAVTLAALPAIVEWRKGWIFPWFMKFLIGLTLIMHIGGGIFKWYFLYYPVYDKIAHVVAAMTIAFMIFLLLFFLEANSIIHLGRQGTVLTIVLVTLFFGLSWELIEYLIDAKFLSTYFLGLNDSLLDTLFNILGTGYIAYHANHYLRLQSPDSLYFPCKRVPETGSA